MNIITITLNPAYDIHYTVKDFTPYGENYACSRTINVGGKGINVSRALQLRGVGNCAYIIAGKENCQPLVREITDFGLLYRIIESPGKIRENITIHSENQPETRVSADTFFIDESVLLRLEEELLETGVSDTIVVFSGRIPKGISIQSILLFLSNLKAHGAKLVVDSNSLSFAQLIELAPWMIKPNEQEIKPFAKVRSLSDALIAAKNLCRLGVGHVLVSMGKEGAAFACQDFCCTAKVPPIRVQSTVGAGDSTVAGFIAAYAKGGSPKEWVKTAMAFGAAACLAAGSLPPSPEDVAKMEKQVQILA